MDKVADLGNNRYVLWDALSLDSIYVTYGLDKDSLDNMNKFSLDELYNGSDVHDFTFSDGEIRVTRKREWSENTGTYVRIKEEDRSTFTLGRKVSMIIVALVDMVRGFEERGIDYLLRDMSISAE